MEYYTRLEQGRVQASASVNETPAIVLGKRMDVLAIKQVWRHSATIE